MFLIIRNAQVYYLLVVTRYVASASLAYAGAQITSGFIRRLNAFLMIFGLRFKDTNHAGPLECAAIALLLHVRRQFTTWTLRKRLVAVNVLRSGESRRSAGWNLFAADVHLIHFL
jgi:hypothetical protein